VIELTLREIADAVGGRLHNATGDELITGSVEFDTRKIEDGALFVALPGERVDGHDFAAKAVDQGAAAVLAAREVDAPAVIVPPVSEAHSRSVALTGDKDGSGAAVLAGLAKLARYVVDRLPELKIVGVTGSSGKTSTKDLIAQVLAPLGATVAPPGSFNNELGHPWTVLRADRDTRHLVLELSARGLHHIAHLCEVAPPHIGVVLNVGSAHLGEFGSREGIAQTKGELVEALPEDGLAVLNADDPLVAAMASRTKARVVFVGEDEKAQIRATDVVLDEQARASFHLVTPQGEADVTLGVTRWKRARACSSSTMSVARISAFSSSPTRTTRALVRPAMAATSGSSALSTARPCSGSASTSSPLACAMPSREPNSPR